MELSWNWKESEKLKTAGTQLSRENDNEDVEIATLKFIYIKEDVEYRKEEDEEKREIEQFLQLKFPTFPYILWKANIIMPSFLYSMIIQCSDFVCD